jgi:hypothetical protein
MNKGHVMNWPPAPVREDQPPREPEESMRDYKRRLWEIEFDLALTQIDSTPVRNALFALRHLTSF